MHIPYNIFGLDIPYDELIKINSQDYTVQENKGNDISSILSMINNGNEVSDSALQKVMAHIAELNITMDEALAINILSETSSFIQEYIRNGNVNNAIDNVYRTLQRKLQTRATAHTKISKTIELLTQLDYEQPIDTLIKYAWDKIDRYIPDSTSKVSVFEAIKELHWCYNIEKICNNLLAATQRMQNQKARIVYRGERKPPKNGVIHYSGIMSTSATLQESFAKYDEYCYVYTLFVPEGVHCMDISTLSGYSDTEKEILFPPCTIHILHQEHQDDKLMIYGLVQDAHKENE